MVWGALFPQLLTKQRLKGNGLPVVPQPSGAVTLVSEPHPGSAGERHPAILQQPPRLIRSSSSSRDSPEPPRGGPQGTRTRRLSTHTRYGAVPAGSQSRCCSVFQEGGSGEALGKVLREDGHHRSTVPWGWCPNIDRSPFLSCLHDTLGALLSPLPSPKFLFFSRLFGTFL